MLGPINNISYFASNDSFIANERPLMGLSDVELIEQCRCLVTINDWKGVTLLLREGSLRNCKSLSHQLTQCIASTKSSTARRLKPYLD